MPVFIILVVLVGVLGFVFVDAYNRLVTLRYRYQNAYAQIDVQLRRRHDLIPNLVQTVKGYLQHERETLEAVIAARNAAVTATQQASQLPNDPQAMQQVGATEAALTGSLGRLLALSESYPDLKADQSIAQLFEELRSTENRISFARQAFNDAVTVYNTRTAVFPSNVVAQLFNFTLATLLEDPTPEVRSVPTISF